MRAAVGIALVAVAVIAVQCHEVQDAKRSQVAALHQVRDAETSRRQWQARYAEAASHVQRGGETVTVRVDRVRTLRDTLRLTDTLEVLRYIAATDSALDACSEFVTSCERLRVAADSTVRSLEAERDAIRQYAESVKPTLVQRYWYVPAIGGVILGAWIRGQ